jgi:hypothetical protein
MSAHLTYEANRARLDELHRYAAERRRARAFDRRRPRLGLRQLLVARPRGRAERRSEPRSAHQAA